MRRTRLPVPGCRCGTRPSCSRTCSPARCAWRWVLGAEGLEDRALGHVSVIVVVAGGEHESCTQEGNSNHCFCFHTFGFLSDVDTSFGSRCGKGREGFGKDLGISRLFMNPTCLTRPTSPTGPECQPAAAVSSRRWPPSNPQRPYPLGNGLPPIRWNRILSAMASLQSAVTVSSRRWPPSNPLRPYPCGDGLPPVCCDHILAAMVSRQSAEAVARRFLQHFSSKGGRYREKTLSLRCQQTDFATNRFANKML